MIKQSNILFQPDKSSSFYVVSTNHSLTHAYMYIIYTSISILCFICMAGSLELEMVLSVIVLLFLGCYYFLNH